VDHGVRRLGRPGHLDLAGNPTNLDGGTAKDEGERVHQQTVWPEVVVSAVVQRELITRRLGDAVNDYQSKLQLAASQLDVDGFAVEFEPESLRGTRFKMIFRLKVKPADGES